MSIDELKLRSPSRYINYAGIAIAVWMAFFPKPYVVALIATLLIMSAAFIFLIMVKSEGENTHGYPPVGGAMIFPPIAILFNSFGYELTNTSGCLFITFVAALVCGFLGAMFWFQEIKAQKWNKLLFTVLAVASLTYGMTVTINCRFDKSPAKPYRVTIVNKHTEYHKGMNYYLKLGDNNPLPGKKEIEVKDTLYDQITIGSQITVNLKSGTLGIPWYYVNR